MQADGQGKMLTFGSIADRKNGKVRFFDCATYTPLYVHRIGQIMYL